MAISNLESEFACKLFRRTPKGVELNRDGEFFKQHAETILRDVEELSSHFEGRDDSPCIIHVAGCQGVLPEFGAKFVHEFERRYINSHVYVREFKDRLVENEIDSGRAELGFGLEPMDMDKYECHRVFSNQLVLLINESDPLAKLDKIPTQVLDKLPLITVDEYFKSADFFIEECARQGVRVEPKFRVGEISAVHRLVKQNLGVGLTTLSVASSLNTDETVFRCFESEDFIWNIDIFKKKNGVLSKGAKNLFAFAQSRLTDMLNGEGEISDSELL